MKLHFTLSQMFNDGDVTQVDVTCNGVLFSKPQDSHKHTSMSHVHIFSADEYSTIFYDDADKQLTNDDDLVPLTKKARLVLEPPMLDSISEENTEQIFDFIVDDISDDSGIVLDGGFLNQHLDHSSADFLNGHSISATVFDNQTNNLDSLDNIETLDVQIIEDDITQQGSVGAVSSMDNKPLNNIYTVLQVDAKPLANIHIKPLASLDVKALENPEKFSIKPLATVNVKPQITFHDKAILYLVSQNDLYTGQ